MSKRAIGNLLCAIAVATLTSLAAQAAGPETKVEGKVVTVDAAKGTVTVSSEGSEQTYTVTPNTTIVGPRGGIVHRKLKDPRFHAGLPITVVVATGTTAKELILGVDRKAAASGAAKGDRSSGFRGDGAAKSDEEDDDNDFPGKVKSVDPDKHMLVITLLNGKDRSFLLSSETKITVGRRVSQKGLSDPAIKAGAALVVMTDEGGKKVKEVKVSGAGAPRGGRRFGLGVRRQPAAD
jgi:hypothetical protein